MFSTTDVSHRPEMVRYDPQAEGYCQQWIMGLDPYSSNDGHWEKLRKLLGGVQQGAKAVMPVAKKVFNVMKPFLPALGALLV